MPRVSVVIPTHNREKWVSKAINSVLAQTFTDLEIIVVDDGSTDRTRQVVENYGVRVRYVFQANAGVSAARNRGILESRGEWVAFLDSDDEWLPEKLEIQMGLVDRHPRLVMVASNVEIDDGVNKINLFDIRERLFQDETELVIENPLLTVCKINFFPTSFIVRKSVLSQAGLFDTTLSYSEDRDLACRVAVLGPLGVLAQPLARIISRGAGDIGLSAAQEKDPRNGFRSSVVSYEKLLRGGKLTSTEKTFVERCLAGSRFYWGMEECRLGNKAAGRSLVWQSCEDYRSIRSMVRASLFFIVGYAGLMWIQNLNRPSGYKRSAIAQANAGGAASE